MRESQVVLSQSMGIEDANLLGFVHGGVIMKLVDNAAGLVAIRHSRGPVVTAAVDEMSFIEPVQLGALVTVAASLNYVGPDRRASPHVQRLPGVRGPRGGKREARPVPRLIAETPDEKRRMREAGIRRDARLARRRKILEARAAGEDAV